MNENEQKKFNNLKELFEYIESCPEYKWTIFDKIRYFFLDTIPSLWYNIKNGISQLIKWTPIIWHEQDWDFGYLYGIMKHKIEFMRAHFKECEFKDTSNNIKWMNAAIELLNRIITEEYCTVIYDKEEKPLESIKKELHAANRTKRLLYKILLKRGSYWWI